jgi:hypothetical protein
VRGLIVPIRTQRLQQTEMKMRTILPQYDPGFGLEYTCVVNVDTMIKREFDVRVHNGGWGRGRRRRGDVYNI